MMKAAVLIILLAVSFLAAGMPVDLDIPETIKGNPAYLDAYEKVDAIPQRFVIDWENQGSVSCRTRVRIDIRNETMNAYTAWTKEVPLEPGDHSDYEAYFYPQFSGNYTAQVFIYHCNTIEDIGNLTFEALVPESTTESANETGSAQNIETARAMPLEIAASNTENRIEMKIKAKENTPDYVIIPKKYPLGWIVESEKVNNMNEKEERTVAIDYVPSIWKPIELEFDIVSLDGKYHSTEKVLLAEEKKGYTTEQLIIGALSLTVIILMILLVRERRKKRAT